jgi:hypothetical protein
MSPPVRGVGGFRVVAMAWALAIWGLAGSSALAQGGGAVAGIAGGPGGQNVLGAYGYGGPVYGVTGAPSAAYGAYAGGVGYAGAVPVGYGPESGVYGLGYPGYGLDYVHGCAMGYHRRHYPGEFSARNWCSYVLGKECLYPYVADPYSDPAAAVPWPPYSAPVAGAAYRARN